LLPHRTLKKWRLSDTSQQSKHFFTSQKQTGKCETPQNKDEEKLVGKEQCLDSALIFRMPEELHKEGSSVSKLTDEFFLLSLKKRFVKQ